MDGTKTNGTGGQPAGTDDHEVLVNSLRFEREKNRVLLEEVVALEDEMVNRLLADFEGVISDDTRAFWQEQLLTNRDGASVALRELAALKTEVGDRKAEGGEQRTEAGGPGSRNPATGEARPRPLHNRSLSRPAPRAGFVGEAAASHAGPAPSGAESLAVKIRNRAHALCETERIPFSVAFRRAEREVGGEG